MPTKAVRTFFSQYQAELEATMEYVYQLLSNEMSDVVEQMKECSDIEQKAILVGRKNLLNYSIKLLKKCEKYGIKPSSIFTQLPDQKCQTPSSEYRIMEDCETDDRKGWIEVEVEGRSFHHVRLHEGDVVIEI